jgi:hypothetical protein
LIDFLTNIQTSTFAALPNFHGNSVVDWFVGENNSIIAEVQR